MAFDPNKHVIRIQGGREYLPVAARLVWFRQEHPDWGIATSPVEINMEKQYAIFSCSIFNADGKLMATATKMENVRGFGDWLEKAETGAVGRALAFCGYGTQFAPELEEGSRLADAPYPQNSDRNRFANGNGRTAPPQIGQDAPSNGITRVREPLRDYADPGGPDDVDEERVFDDVAEAMSATTAPVDSAPLAPPKQNHLAGNRCSIDGCPNVLTSSQMTMSEKKFGRALCLLHQRDAQPLAQKEPASAGR